MSLTLYLLLHSPPPTRSDVISHLPVLCEENSVPYVYVNSKADLGEAASTKRPTSCVFISVKGEFEFKDKFDEVVTEVKTITPTL